MRLDLNENELLYSTYLGEDGLDHATAVALDPVGGLWVSGETVGGFRTTPNAFQRTNRGINDTFLVHLDPTAEGEDQLVYSTLLGGGSNDPPGRGLVVSPSGYVLVGGLSQSNDFPLAGEGCPFQGGRGDAFLSVLDPAGGLFHSTYIGGSGWDEINSLALTPSGKVVATGDTLSAMFKGLPGINSNGAEDAFVVTLDILPVMFRRGDCTDDGIVNISDAICILNWLFSRTYLVPNS